MGLPNVSQIKSENCLGFWRIRQMQAANITITIVRHLSSKAASPPSTRTKLSKICMQKLPDHHHHASQSVRLQSRKAVGTTLPTSQRASVSSTFAGSLRISAALSMQPISFSCSGLSLPYSNEKATAHFAQKVQCHRVCRIFRENIVPKTDWSPSHPS